MATLLIGFERGGISDDEVAQVQQAAPDMNILVTKDPHKIEEVVEDVEVAAGWLSPEIILNIPNLRWYQQWAAGADWMLPRPEGVEKDFILTNGSGIHAICISEQIFSYLLSFARALPAAHRSQAAGVWKQAPGETLFELAGKTMVLVGLGDIGLRTARLATAFEMRVIGVDRDPLLYVPGAETVVTPDHLTEVAAEADVMVVALPHTKETKGIISRSVIEAIKPGAYFVNIGRGPTVDEAALIDALQSGAIAGAGLDVFEVEPLPADSPLWAMDNVIITAHYAGATPVYQKRAMAIFLENLRRYQAGERLHNVVNKGLGY